MKDFSGALKDRPDLTRVLPDHIEYIRMDQVGPPRPKHIPLPYNDVISQRARLYIIQLLTNGYCNISPVK
jgi:hypothetical protein